MSKRNLTNCHRCGSVLQAEAEVCSTCCAPQNSVAPQPFRHSERELAAVAPRTAEATAQTGLAAWPFGQADAEAAAQVAARAVASDVRAELSHYSAQSSTHTLSAIPAQRPAAHDEPELHSVPSTGPNPFLAAARLQQARDEAAVVEGYPV